jgi:DNA-binding transcriptional regulator YhcF (GntR family)
MEHEKYQVNHATGEVKLVNTNFIQFYEDNIDLFDNITKENPNSLRIFWWILKRMDESNALVVSQQTIADALNIHKNTVYLATKYLKEHKILTVLKSGGTTIYVLNSKIVWKSDADSKKYAHFTAKVYITPEEQDIQYQTQLFGHAVKKPKKAPKKIKISPDEAIKGFERANPRQKEENAV